MYKIFQVVSKLNSIQSETEKNDRVRNIAYQKYSDPRQQQHFSLVIHLK